MKIIVANVDSKAKSNKHIDLKMKRSLSNLKFTGSYIGRYDLISNDFEERIFEIAKNFIEKNRNYFAAHKNHTQSSKIFLKYYGGIQYIIIMIHKDKIRVNVLYDTGINLSNNRFIDLIEDKVTGNFLIKQQHN